MDLVISVLLRNNSVRKIFPASVYIFLIVLSWCAAQADSGIHVLNLSGWVGADGYYKRDSNTSDSESSDWMDREMLIAEMLHLKTLLSVVDKNFMLFSLEGTLAQAQDQRKKTAGGETTTHHSNNTTGSYDLNLKLFRNRPFRVHLYSRYQDAYVQRRLGDLFIMDDTRRGAKCFFRSTRWGWNAEYLHREHSGERFGSHVDETFKTFSSELDAAFPGMDADTTYIFRKYAEAEESISRNFLQSTTLLNGYWGADTVNRSHTFFQYWKDTGDIPSKGIYARETLGISPAPDWTATSGIKWIRKEFDAFVATAQSISADLNYDSGRWGIAGLDAELMRDRFSDSTRKSWDMRVRCSNKFDLDSSIIRVNGVIGYENTSYDARSGESRAVGERHRFPENDRIELEADYILPETITIRDATGGLVYEAERDYLVLQTGVRTSIVRLSTGLIPYLGEITADYAFRIPSDAAYQAHSQHLNIAWSRNQSIQLFCDIDARHPFVKTGDMDLIESYSLISLGISLRWKHLSTRLQGHLRTSDIIPESGITAVVDFRFPEFAGFFWSGVGGCEYIEYKRRGGFSRLIYAQSRLRRQITHRGSISITGYWRDDKTVQIYMQNFEVAVELKWHYRSMLVEYGYFYRHIQRPFGGEINHVAQIKIRRFF